jgi:Gas vesicle synthesis protein GvpO
VTDEQSRRERRGRVEADPSQAAGRHRRPSRLSGGQLAQRARQELAEITGLEAESVTALARADDIWSVTVELLELPRMPDTDDLLGSYEAQLDDSGELLRYRRVRRYPRSRG